MEALAVTGVILTLLLVTTCGLFFLLGVVDRVQGRNQRHTRWVAQSLPPVIWHAWLMGYGLIELIAKRVDFAERKRIRYERREELLDNLENR